MYTKLSLTLILLLGVNCGWSQKGKNNRDFDRRPFHFGFSIGGTTSDLRYQFIPGVYHQDTIVNVSTKALPGIAFAMIGSWNINEQIHLRVNFPMFSIQEREFDYQFLKGGELITEKYRLEATNLDFPVMLKLRTKRINNFAAYGLTGLHFGIDLASQHEVATNPGDRIMKVQKYDFASHFGGGFDFFLPYFKFAVELKITNGLKNILIQDQTFFAAPLTDLRSKVWWLSITFEGGF